MDIKSPMSKRQKLIGTDFNDVRDEMNHMVQLRKTAAEIIDDLYSAIATERLKYLLRTQVELASSNKQTEVLKVDNVLQSIKRLSKEHDKVIRKNRDHIILLNMVRQKRDCSISKIIDKI